MNKHLKQATLNLKQRCHNFVGEQQESGGSYGAMYCAEVLAERLYTASTKSDKVGKEILQYTVDHEETELRSSTAQLNPEYAQFIISINKEIRGLLLN